MPGVDRSMHTSRPEDASDRIQVHGTTIAIRAAIGDDAQPTWVAAMIRGPSGSGKSDLALRCLVQPLNALFPAPAQALGVRLVADDRTVLAMTSPSAATVVTASAPPSIAGLLEVRGLGVVAVPHIPEARLILIVDLVAPAEVTRYPALERTPIALISSVAELPRYVMTPFEVASPLKLLLALARTASTGCPVGADAAKHHCLPEGQ